MKHKKVKLSKKAESLKSLNKQINFDRESTKTNARKDETKVTCILCKKQVVLPFKPRKPEIYCNACFKKKNKKEIPKPKF